MGQFVNRATASVMNFEDLETHRAAGAKRVMDAMVKIVENETVDVEQRVAAARTFDAMSDSVIKAYFTSDMTDKMPDGNQLHDDIRRMKEGS